MARPKTGRPRDPRNLQRKHGVSFPEAIDRMVCELADEREVHVAEVIRELVAAGLKASR